MTVEQQSGTDIETHLRRALETAENSETRYHLREALQKCSAAESVQFGSASAFDD
ncbi:hypothetical protein [Halovenus carboxidivorans]|uniref:hypothetical protein n=1 Tax=Halovenus carboxidivorans TaxID=2692199 RepID=UPI0019156A21|nr:hypothetical protein [Halovenus carboxidivorans]